MKRHTAILFGAAFIAAVLIALMVPRSSPSLRQGITVPQSGAEHEADSEGTEPRRVVIELGDLNSRERIRREFRVSNDTERVWAVERIAAGCRCNGRWWVDSDLISPGEELCGHLDLAAPESDGPFNQMASIHLSERRGEIEVRAEGRVTLPLIAEPRSLDFVLSLDDGQKAQTTMVIDSRVSGSEELIVQRLPTWLRVVELSPLSLDTDTIAKKRWRLKIEAGDKEIPATARADDFLVLGIADREDGLLTIPVSLRRLEPVQITPSQLYFTPGRSPQPVTRHVFVILSEKADDGTPPIPTVSDNLADYVNVAVAHFGKHRYKMEVRLTVPDSDGLHGNITIANSAGNILATLPLICKPLRTTAITE